MFHQQSSSRSSQQHPAHFRTFRSSHSQTSSNMAPPHIGMDCSLCGGAKCASAKLRLATMSPALAVKIAGREGPNSCFLFQLIAASHSDPHYRHSGMADMCIRHIVQEQQSEDLRHWEHPITGLLTIFASVDHSDSRDAAILQKIHSSYPRIFRVIADDIVDSSIMVSNIAKMIACHFLQRCLRNCVVKQYIIPSCRMILCAHLIYKRSMYDEYTLGLIFHCWLEPDISQPNSEASQARVTAARVLAHLLSIDDSHNVQDITFSVNIRQIVSLWNPHLMRQIYAEINVE